MYSTLILLFVMVCLSLSLFYNLKRGSVIMYLLMAVLFSLLMAFRSHTIPDTENYIQIFENLSTTYHYDFSLVEEYKIYGIEYGFLWLCVGFKKYLSHDYHLFFFLIALFNIVISTQSFSVIIDELNLPEVQLQKGQNNQKKLCLLSIIYISFFGLYYSGIAIRSGVAMSMVLAAIAAACKKRYLYTVLFFLVAFSMHKLSIVGVAVLVIFLFFPKIKKGIYIIAWTIIGAAQFLIQLSGIESIMKNMLYEISGRFVALDYSRYLVNDENESGKFVFVIWVLGYSLIALVYDANKNIHRLFNVYLFGLGSIMCLSWVNGYSRITDYFIMMGVPIVYEVSLYSKKMIKKDMYIRRAAIYMILASNLYKVLVTYQWP